MLQLAQRTSAPSATRVWMSTAVCTVMCSEPVMCAPLSGWRSAYSWRVAIRPGISCSASSISLRPKSASCRSATLKSAVLDRGAVVALMGVSVCSLGVGSGGGPQAEEPLVLVLLPGQPLAGGNVVGTPGGRLKPRLDRRAQVWVAPHAQREAHVG